MTETYHQPANNINLGWIQILQDVCVYIYIYIYICVCVRERERERVCVSSVFEYRTL